MISKLIDVISCFEEKFKPHAGIVFFDNDPSFLLHILRGGGSWGQFILHTLLFQPERNILRSREPYYI